MVNEGRKRVIYVGYSMPEKPEDYGKDTVYLIFNKSSAEGGENRFAVFSSRSFGYKNFSEMNPKARPFLSAINRVWDDGPVKIPIRMGIETLAKNNDARIEYQEGAKEILEGSLLFYYS